MASNTDTPTTQNSGASDALSGSVSPDPLIAQESNSVGDSLDAFSQAQPLSQNTAAAADDSVSFSLSYKDASYYPGSTDSDAKYHLGDVDTKVNEIDNVDTTLGGFGDPTNHNHWGAARDGSFYADGVECTPGSFGTLADGLNHVSWRNTEEDPFKIDNSTSVNNSLTTVSDDVIRMSCQDNGWPLAAEVSSDKKWSLSGDFDIQVDFLNVSTSGSAYAAGISVRYNYDGIAGTNSVGVRRANDRYEFFYRNNGAFGTVATAGGNDVSGKLRLVRTSGTVHAYYWTGSAWTEVGSGYLHALGDADVTVALHVYTTSNYSLSVDWTAFTINSGTWSNKAGWYRELSNADRGSRQDMPESLVIVMCNKSLDLIDVNTDKLWMRFNRDTYNAFFNYDAYDSELHSCAWSDGTLLVGSRSSVYVSDEGGAIVIDFTMDSIRAYRKSVSPVTGGLYTGCDAIASGVIQLRNDGKHYSHDDDTWSIPLCRVDNVAIFRDVGYEYRAVVTGDTITIFKHQRWFFKDNMQEQEYTATSHTYVITALAFDSAGNLFYRSYENVYQVNRSTWEDSFTTTRTFSYDRSDSTAPLASSHEAYTLLVYDGVVYIASYKGIWAWEWATDSIYLLYGPKDSSAAHEIIYGHAVGAFFDYWYLCIRDMVLTIENSTPTLVVVYDSKWYIVEAIDLVNDVVTHRLIGATFSSQPNAYALRPTKVVVY